MGKRKEARLKATLERVARENDALRAEKIKAREDEINARRIDMTEALEEMRSQKFIVVTHTGRVVSGHAITTSMQSTPVEVTASDSTWRQFVSGAIDYGAQIQIMPFD